MDAGGQELLPDDIVALPPVEGDPPRSGDNQSLQLTAIAMPPGTARGRPAVDLWDLIRPKNGLDQEWVHHLLRIRASFVVCEAADHENGREYKYVPASQGVLRQVIRAERDVGFRYVLEHMQGADLLRRRPFDIEDDEAFDRRDATGAAVLASGVEIIWGGGGPSLLDHVFRQGGGPLTTSFLCDSAVYPMLQRHGGDLRIFCFAAERNCVDLLRFLASSLVDVNAPNERGKTALYCAAHGGAQGAARFLLTLPAIDVNAGAIQEGETPLWHAVWKGYESIARPLVAAPGIHGDRCEGKPLAIAVTRGGAGMVRLLLSVPGVGVNGKRAPWLGVPLVDVGRA